MDSDLVPSNSEIPAWGAALVEQQPAAAKPVKKLFSSKAMSQLRNNFSRAAAAPLFKLHKHPGSQPDPQPKIPFKPAAATCPLQERRTSSSRARAPLLLAPAVAPASLAVVPEDSLPETKENVYQLQHSLTNLEILRTLGVRRPASHFAQHVYR